MDRRTVILKKLLTRLMGFIAAMLLLSIIVFYIARLAPGDPLQSFYGDAVESMTTQELQEARKRLGLDAPNHIQYIRWITNAFHGEFGLSLKYKIPVMEVVSPLIGNTLILGGISYLVVFIFAILLAISCALFEDTLFDRIICKVGTAAYYIPAFWLGVVLVLIFSINLNWLPSSGAYDFGKSGDLLNRLEHLVLPLIVMVLSHLWYYAYMFRNKLLDEFRKDYIILAKTKGLKKVEIIVKHCLRNIAPTIISIMAISSPHILSGTYIAEAVFNYPGIGALSVESAKYHDYNLLMLLVLITGVLVIISSIIAQSINEMIDPMLKEQEAATWKKATKNSSSW
ncbi:ABC transporter permease [Oceanobacillus chungangensis]|uniref:ABC transporter permease n=1 Tax=Oceanobacillus chungangensis TaxID=1229152 RepID=UPI001B861225|nr:ABC transporter permease [Oceanobacillus chungangensis]